MFFRALQKFRAEVAEDSDEDREAESPPRKVKPRKKKKAKVLIDQLDLFVCVDGENEELSVFPTHAQRAASSFRRVGNEYSMVAQIIPTFTLH